jgi:hypothetical protein
MQADDYFRLKKFFMEILYHNKKCRKKRVSNQVCIIPGPNQTRSLLE